MSDLVVIACKDPATAFAMRAELFNLQKEYLLQMEDIVVVTRDADEKVRLHQAADLTAMGAVSGGFWGLLIGLIFFNPLFGAALGAGAGALSGALADAGINDDFMRDLGRSLAPGGAAVFLLVRKMTTDKVIERLKTLPARGEVLQTSLSHDDEATLRAALQAQSAA